MLFGYSLARKEGQVTDVVRLQSGKEGGASYLRCLVTVWQGRRGKLLMLLGYSLARKEGQVTDVVWLQSGTEGGASY